MQPLQRLCQGSSVHLNLGKNYASFGSSQECMAAVQGPTVSGKDIDAVPGLGLVSDSADSMDVSRRQSVRYTISVLSCTCAT